MKFLHRISAAKRIYAVTALAVASVLGAVAWIDISLNARAEERLVAAVEARLAATTRLIERFAEAAEAGRMTTPYAQARALAMVGAQPMEDGAAILVFDAFGVLKAQALPQISAPSALGGAETETETEETGGVERVMRHAVVEPWGWTVRSSNARDAVLAAIEDRRATIELPLLIFAGLLLILGVLLGRSVLRPMRKVSERLKSMAEGELSADIPYLEARDSSGQAARALAALRDNVEHYQIRYARDMRSVETGAARLLDALQTAAQNGATRLGALELDQRLAELGPAAETALKAAAETVERRLNAKLSETAAELRAETERLQRAGETQEAADAVFARALAAIDASRPVEEAVRKAMDEADHAEAADARRRAEAVAKESSLLALGATMAAAQSGGGGREAAELVRAARALSGAAGASARRTRALVDHASELARALQASAESLSEFGAVGAASAELSEGESAAVSLAAAVARLTALAEEAEAAAAGEEETALFAHDDAQDEQEPAAPDDAENDADPFADVPIEMEALEEEDDDGVALEIEDPETGPGADVDLEDDADRSAA